MGTFVLWFIIGLFFSAGLTAFIGLVSKDNGQGRRFQLRTGLSHLNALFAPTNLLAPLRADAYHNGLAHAFFSFHGVSTHSGFLQRISIAHSRFHAAASR